MKKARFASAVAAATLCIAVAGSAIGSAHAEDLKIGALFPLSGPNSAYGDIFASGANLAAQHVNADNMLGGRLTIEYEDSQALPQPAVVGMTKLIEVSQVPYVLSAFTGVSKAISTLAQRSETVAVNGGGVGPDLAKLGPYFWNVIPLANLEVRAMVPYLADQGLKKVALVYVDDPLGQSILDELKATLPDVGGELVDAMSVPTNTQNFSGIAAKVRSAGADVVYIASYGAQQVQIAKQLRDNGVEAQFASYSGFSVPEAMKLPEADGLLFTTQAVDYTSSDPVTKRFVTDYEASHHRMPSAYVANYYNAVRLFALLAHALEEKGEPVTGANLLAQRKATKSFDLVGGTVSFQDNGTLLAPIQVNRVEKGAPVALTTVSIQ
ncbi:amino acid/amide ABC transporter substrate-binding protein (HAAT family) [Breoghania corrubedonensis]|uniref:Amino acid/amide ABC transporter substrate-binding protein (HAAT family) n=1 Tax=Breoghania corrubedonensis TaxID=665038 RepID=A0A2T5VFV4_9HYPH|nr:ABC transporter substrate-binding protein [Breoghania corrubedonensis]PTW62629.1 amino acid/amide ABC transporter substrate-binding protein (HAAT family) [Breoghania corrubedonensis]